MTLTAILVLALIALAVRTLLRPAGLAWALFGLSVVAVFWLQPALPVRGLAFWLPLLTLALALFGWLLTTPPEARGGRENRAAGAALAGIALAMTLTRMVTLPAWLSLPAPPPLTTGLIGLGVIALLGLVAGRFARPAYLLLTLFTGILIALLVVLKLPALTEYTAAGLRALAAQDPSRALATDLRWLGFSYLAFRLIHTLRDRQTGRLPVVSLREYMTYAVFFPAFTAGPIDRLERFVKDLRAPTADGSLPVDLLDGGKRLALGLFKKFVLADTLALVALSPQTAAQVTAPGWLWLFLYAYAFQILLDFSGYTDIAIGLGLILGIRLPENFNRPYLRPNLGQFWNNWHMTLTHWFRAYYFNPLTRALRGRLPQALIILVTQVTTMLLIGLWHGITLSFVAWGLWHGVGLFLQNRWTDFMRARAERIPARLQPVLNGLSVLFTFHYVALGWVFFALNDIQQAGRVVARLFGF